MNPAPHLQTAANISVALAALIYLVPLQWLLFELSRKRDDGGGALAGFLLLVPMWLLLLGAVSCVTASRGFDGLGLGRPALYLLAVLAVVSMTVLSFMCLEFPRHPSLPTRLIGRLPVTLLPPLTMLLAVLSLNPGLPGADLLPGVQRVWLACAGISLALVGGFLGYRFLAVRAAWILAVLGRGFGRGASEREVLANLLTLDPQREFAELLARTDLYQSSAVRQAVVDRLRTLPDFVARLAAELDSRSPEHALSAVEFGGFTPEERKLLAPPARRAIERLADRTRNELCHIPKDRRRRMRRSGRHLFSSIASQLEGTGVDFQPAIAAFDSMFNNPDGNSR